MCVCVQGRQHAPPETAEHVGRRCRRPGLRRTGIAGSAQHELAAKASGTGQIAQHFRHFSVVAFQTAKPNVSLLLVMVCVCVCLFVCVFVKFARDLRLYYVISRAHVDVVFYASRLIFIVFFGVGGPEESGIVRPSNNNPAIGHLSNVHVSGEFHRTFWLKFFGRFPNSISDERMV